jgi:CRISPR/Cas system-associated endoribonuclease Cas2
MQIYANFDVRFVNILTQKHLCAAIIILTCRWVQKSVYKFRIEILRADLRDQNRKVSKYANFERDQNF